MFVCVWRGPVCVVAMWATRKNRVVDEFFKFYFFFLFSVLSPPESTTANLANEGR
jgi:hypothetical protein